MAKIVGSRRLLATSLLRVTLVNGEGGVRFSYKPPNQDQAEQFAPSAAWRRIRQEPGFQTDRRFARVDANYSREPGGPTLGALAEGRGLWRPARNSPGGAPGRS